MSNTNMTPKQKKFAIVVALLAIFAGGWQSARWRGEDAGQIKAEIKAEKTAVTQHRAVTKKKDKKLAQDIAASDTAVEEYNYLDSLLDVALYADTTQMDPEVDSLLKQKDSAIARVINSCSVVKLSCAEANVAKDSLIVAQDRTIAKQGEALKGREPKATRAMKYILIGGATGWLIAKRRYDN